MKRTFTARITREDKWYIAQCVEVDVASQGETEQQAVDNLREAIILYFESPSPTALPVTRKIEVEIGAA